MPGAPKCEPVFDLIAERVKKVGKTCRQLPLSLQFWLQKSLSLSLSPLSSFPFLPLSTFLLASTILPSSYILSVISSLLPLPFLTFSISFSPHLGLLPSLNQDGPSLVKKVKGSFLFKVTASDGSVHEWLIDLKKGNGSVTKSPGVRKLFPKASLIPLVWAVFALALFPGPHPASRCLQYCKVEVLQATGSWARAWERGYLLLSHITPFLFPGKKGDCIVSIKDADFMDLVSGKLGPQKVQYFVCMPSFFFFLGRWCGSLV